MAKRTKPEVLSEAPDGLADMGQAGAVNVADLTEKASTAVSVFKTLPAWEPHPTLVEIAKMKEEKLKLLADVATPAGLKLCKAAKREVVSLCTAVDERRKQEGRDALEYKRAVDKAGNTVMEKLREISDTLEAAIKAEEQKEIEAALAKAKAIEEEQRQKEEQRLALLAAEEKRKKDEAEAELRRRQEAIDREKAEFEERQKEFQKQQAELREAQEKLRLEQERQNREAQARERAIQEEKERRERAEREERERKERAEREEKERKEREAQAEVNRLATEQRIKEAKEKAAAAAVEAERLRVKRLEEELTAKALKEQAAKEKKARLAPDVDKVAAWVKRVLAAMVPACEIKDPTLAATFKAKTHSIADQLVALTGLAKKAGE
jgi:hypothetical protein